MSIWNLLIKKQNSFQEALKSNGAHPNTPDANLLMEKSAWLLMIYGEQMKGFKFNNEMTEGEKLCNAFTDERDKMLWRLKDGSNSRVVMTNRDETITDGYRKIKINRRLAYPSGRVKGELYLVPTHLLFNLDNWYENGVSFQRKRIDIIVPDRVIPKHRIDTEASAREWVTFDQFSSKLKKSKAWVYEGNPEYWKDKVKELDCVPVSSYTPLSHKSVSIIGDFYCYSHREYQEKQPPTRIYITKGLKEPKAA